MMISVFKGTLIRRVLTLYHAVLALCIPLSNFIFFVAFRSGKYSFATTTVGNASEVFSATVVDRADRQSHSVLVVVSPQAQKLGRELRLLCDLGFAVISIAEQQLIYTNIVQ